MKAVKHVTKKCIVYVLTLAMLLTIVPVTAFAAADGTEDTQSPVIAGTLELDQTISASAEEGEIYYAFTPEESGEYKIYSSDYDGDSYVTLYDENMEYISKDDDGGDGSNFSLLYTLEADKTYYYGVRQYSNGSFTFNITLIKTNYVNVILHANHEDAYYSEYDEELDDYVPVESLEEQVESGGKIGRYTVSEPNVLSDDISFAGWSTDPNADNPDDTIIASEGLELYAVWRNSYKVTFELGVGIDQAYYEGWDDETQEYGSYTHYSDRYAEGSEIWGGSWPTIIDDSITLIGWSEDPDATVAHEGDFIVNGDMTLYAVWRKNCRVTYDLQMDTSIACFEVWNSETGEYEETSTCTQSYYEGYDILENVYEYPDIRDDRYRLLGWSTDPDATEADDSIILSDLQTTVYAVWRIDHEVTFDLNTDIDRAWYEIWNSDTHEYEKSLTTTKYFEDGYEIDRYDTPGYNCNNDRLLGWSTDPEATKPDTEIVITDDITLYAVWLRAYDVTLNANGGYFDMDGEDGEPTIRVGVPVYEGETLGTHKVYHSDLFKTFDGWYDQATGGKKYDENSIITQDTVLYAHWKEVIPETLQAEDVTKTSAGTYQATYQFVPDEAGIYIFNSADLSGSYPKVALYDKDMQKLSDTYSQVSGGNFLFRYELKAGETYYFVIDNTKQSTYAYPVKIAKAATAVVTFDANRTDATMDVTSQNAAIGYTLSLYSFEPKTAEGDDKVRFAGWSKDKDSESGEYNTTITEDTTLYAVWKETGTVIFHANHEGAYFGAWDEDEGYQYNETRTENLDVGTTIYSRYYSPSWENVDGQRIEFAGWSVNQDATEPDAEITVSDGLDLYAVWKEVGESSEEVTPLELDQEVTVVSDGTYVWYSFIPDETGTYCVESSENIDCDPYIELYDADKDYLSESDDDGNGRNFRLIYTLEAGETYHLQARNYSYASGLNYKMILTKPVTADVTFYVNHADAYYIDWDDDDNEIRSSSRTETMLAGDEIDWNYQPETNNDSIMFAGWSTDPKATEADDEIVASSGLELYAVWNDAVKITFDTNCDSTEDAWFNDWDEDDNRIRTKTIENRYEKDSRIYRYSEEPNTDNARLCFLGWSEDKNATEPDADLKADQSKTVYAVWGENAFVTCDANGGYFQGYGTICANSIFKGDTFEPGRIPDNADPTKVFAGWATTKNATEPNVTYNTVVNNDMTVYAVWKDGIKVTIDANGGYFYQNGVKKTVIDVYVLAGSTIDDLDTWARNDDPLKSDYGYRSKTATGDALDFDTEINASMTLYVKWVDLVEVTFDAQDGLINGQAFTTEYWRKGSERSISRYWQATCNDSTKTFVGWSTKKGDASKIVSSLTPTQSTTLYAIYSDGYLITLESADKTRGSVEVKVNGEYISSEGTDNIFIWPKGLKAENLACSGMARSGYLFKGLSTSKDQKDIISDSFIPTKATTLYGIFVPGYHVSLNAGEGYYDDYENTIFLSIDAGDTIGSIDLPTPPAGKVFDGWMIWDEDQEAWVDVKYEVTTHKPTSYEMYRAKYTDASDTINLAGAQISVAETVKYTGQALKPAVTVTYNGKKLTNNTDYTVSYTDNTGVGLATVTIKGKGDYSGTRTAQFRILFKDVDQSNNFYDAIYWMVDEGYTTGYSDGTYRPWNSVNRAAVVTFLWRMAESPEPAKIAGFKDMPTNNDDFMKAISWAAEQGITSGYSDGTFRPWANCNRAAIVTFLWRYQGKPSVSSIAGFKDMPADTDSNQDFRKAISWAAANGITSGWADNTFRPWNDCNRAAMASFLSKME